MTVYQNNIPLANDPLSESQSDLRNNFNAHNEFFGVDHVRYSAPSDIGKHLKSTYVAQGAPPGVAADEIANYSEDNGNGRINLKTRYQSNGATLGIAPFCAARFSLLTGPTVGFLGSQVNVNQVTTAWDNVSKITVNFLTDAANTDYFVFVQVEVINVGAFLITVPTVNTKAVGSFIIEYNNMGINQILDILVYEQ